MVGSACLEKAVALGNYEVLVRTRAELDLTDQAAVRAFFQKEKPDLVLDAAAKVGGIKANATQPVEFLLQNLQIQNHLMEAAFAHGCRKFLFLGSSCVYPKLAAQPIREDSLLTGPLEPTNEAYAVAKIAGIKLGQAYRRQYGKSVISVMPANLYGPREVLCESGSTWRIWQTLFCCFWKSMMERRFSILVPVRRPPSVNWQNGWPRWWGSPVGWSGTPPSLTAPPARRWTHPVFLRWVGGRRSRCGRV